jgi:kojibiose phosphorylase
VTSATPPYAPDAVVVDWAQAVASGVEPAVLTERLDRLSALGVDAVLFNAGTELRPRGPGRVLATPAHGGSAVELTADGPSPLDPDDAVGAALLDGCHPLDVLVLASGEGVTAEHLLAALDAVAAAHRGTAAPAPDPRWQIVVDGFDPEREPEVESILTVANGRTGTRGAVEDARPHRSPGFYTAGLFAHPDEPPPPTLMVGPDWVRLRPRVDGADVALDATTPVHERRVLDLRHGTLYRDVSGRLASGATWTFHSARFASLADRAVHVLEATGDSGGQEVVLGDDVPPPRPQPGVAVSTPTGSGDVVALQEPHGIATFATLTREQHGRLQRLVAVARQADNTNEGDAVAALAAADATGLTTLRAHHRRAWLARWHDADVVIGAEDKLQREIRFALAHLMATGDPESPLASIGARGLSGPGYRGHVFWDTDVFIVPFFIWTHPPTARALLGYRYRTLPAACAKARRYGYEGALYAWESADTGEETTPLVVRRSDGLLIDILTGEMEHHISADVAWAAWEYWKITGDESYLVDEGAEIIIQTARFWASRAEAGDDGRYHIRRVIGPDEYHEDVDDSAYTNVMARWNLRTAVAVIERLKGADPSAFEALAAKLDVGPDEPARWLGVADRLVDGFDPETLLYEQFDGFFGLEDLRAEDFGPRPFTGDTVLGIPRVRHAQMVKQADVLMLPMMLPEEVPPAVAAANWRYYEPRTSHGSSLSPGPHALIGARIGALDEADWYFRLAAGIDLENVMGNAAEGVHFAALGALWQAAVVGFGGVRADGDTLRLDPRLAPSWDRLSFPLRWRGGRVSVDIAPGAVTVSLDRPATVAVGGGPPTPLAAGRYVARREGDGWGPLDEARPS